MRDFIFEQSVACSKVVRRGKNRLMLLLCGLLFISQLTGISFVHAAEYAVFMEKGSVITEIMSPEADDPSAGRAIRWRQVSLSPAVVETGLLNKGDMIKLDLFDDRVYSAIVDRVVKNINGTFTVRARVNGHPMGYLLISTTCDSSLGLIHIPEITEKYLIIDDPGLNRHYLLELDAGKMDEPEGGPSLTAPSPPPEELESDLINKQIETAELGPLDHAIIDIMIVYTPAALSSAGNLEIIQNRIAQSMEIAQLTLDNSAVYISLNLIHSAQVDYVESGSSEMDLRRLAYRKGNYYDPVGYMDEALDWRDTYGADLVSLFALVNDVSGRGFLLQDKHGDPINGFNLNSIIWAGIGYTFIHEIGHNMGLHHHWEQNTSPGPTQWFNWPENKWSAGWRWVEADEKRYCSIMTYGGGVYYTDGQNHSRVPLISNPGINHNGTPSGHPEHGDNARTLREIKQIIAAYRTRVLPEGEIVAWGSNDHGQCNVPEPNEGFVFVDCGQFHSVGLKKDGSIVAWGSNLNGETDVPDPNSGFVAVSAGLEHNLGLKYDGSIVAWGINSFSECNVPEPNSGFVAVSAGTQLSLGLKCNGTIVLWGNECPVLEPNMGFVAAAASNRFMLGLKSDGLIIARGVNDHGQCDVPAQNSDFVALAAGMNHSLGLKTDGSIVVWGSNLSGQCDVPGPNSDFVALAAGMNHSLGLKTNGSIIAWGSNLSGQCDVPEPNSDFLNMAGGLYHSLGIKGYGKSESALIVNPPLHKVSKDAGITTFTIMIDGTESLNWTAAVISGEEWLSINTETTGTESGMISVSYEQYEGANIRTGYVFVNALGATGSPKIVKVIQTSLSLEKICNAVLGRTTDAEGLDNNQDHLLNVADIVHLMILD